MTKRKKFVLILTLATLAFNAVIVLFPESIATDNFIFKFIGMMDTPGIGLYELMKSDSNALSAIDKFFKIVVMTIGTTLFWLFVRSVIDVIKKTRSGLK